MYKVSFYKQRATISINRFKLSIRNLQELRTEDQFVKFVPEAKGLWICDSDKTDFKSIHIRRIKKIDDEQQRNEAPTVPIIKYRITIFFKSLDSILER